MKLKEVTIEQIKNLGNYENVKLSMSAVLQKGDNASEVIDNLQRFIDYKLNESVREAKYKEFVASIQEGNLSEKALVARQAWLDKYHALNSEIEKLDWINVDE